jgi:energy-coupling factor transport system permease protein
MLLYEFSTRNSFLASLNPITKIVIAIFYVILVLLAPLDYLMILYFLLPIFVIAIFGRIWPWEYIGFILLLLPMVVALLILQVFFFAGDPKAVFVIPIIEFPLYMSIPGVSFGLSLGIRIMAMAMSFSMFVMSTDPFDIGHAVNNLGLRFRASYMIGFAMRLFPLVQEELNNIGNAAEARGYPSMFSLNPINMLRGLTVTFVPLAVGSLKRGTQMALAMEIRGYSLPEQLGTQRTYMKEVRFRKRDWFVIVLFFAAWISWMYWRINLILAGF